MPSIKLYTADEVAEMTSMSVDWLWRACRERRIPFHRLGGRYRWTDDDLKELVRQTAMEPRVSDRMIPLRGSRPRPGRSQNHVDGVHQSIETGSTEMHC